MNSPEKSYVKHQQEEQRDCGKLLEEPSTSSTFPALVPALIIILYRCAIWRI